MVDLVYYIIYLGSPVVKNPRVSRPRGAVNFLCFFACIYTLAISYFILVGFGATEFMVILVPVAILLACIADYKLGKRYNYKKICELDDRYKDTVNRSLAKLIYRIVFLSVFFSLFVLMVRYS